jgi:hypothetical protein
MRIPSTKAFKPAGVSSGNITTYLVGIKRAVHPRISQVQINAAQECAGLTSMIGADFNFRRNNWVIFFRLGIILDTIL